MRHTANTHKRMGGGRTAASVCERIKRDISASKLRAGEYLPPVRELCRIHGVAINTVQRALKSMSAEGLIASELRQGYRVLARANDPESGCPVGLVFRSSSTDRNPQESSMVLDFQHAAAAQGRSVVAVSAGEDNPGQVMEQLLAARAWGAIITTTEPAVFEQFQNAGLPAVVAENWSPDCQLDAVSQDDFRGSLDAAVHLAQRGHKDIAWFGSALEMRNMHAAGRYAGSVAGLAFFSLRLRPELTVENPPSTHEQLVDVACRLLSRKDRPTAVLALWQDKFHALVVAANKLGLRIGKDLEVVGWSTEEGYAETMGVLFKERPYPPMVTWSQRMMAEMALAVLAQRRAKPDAPPANQSVPTRLRLDEFATTNSTL